MPQGTFTTTTAAAAGTTYAPLTGWAYEFLPWPARVKILAWGSAASNLQIYSGSESIMDPSPIDTSGAVNKIPNDLSVHPVIFDAPAGDRLRLIFTTTTAGATGITCLVLVTPLA
jgi:hypothetical protein